MKIPDEFFELGFDEEVLKQKCPADLVNVKDEDVRPLLFFLINVVLVTFKEKMHQSTIKLLILFSFDVTPVSNDLVLYSDFFYSISLCYFI